MLEKRSGLGGSCSFLFSAFCLDIQVEFWGERKGLALVGAVYLFMRVFVYSVSLILNRHAA